jgi:hypothetical protein
MNKAEKTRQFIIEKTAPLFNTKGVAATAVTDIMEVTQMAACMSIFKIKRSCLIVRLTGI